MLRVLCVQVEIREEGRPGRTASASLHLIPEEDAQYPPAPVPHLPTASALAAESVAVTEEACPLCNSCHPTIAECSIQLSADEKRARLRSARCCYRCGRSNHMARFCRRAGSIMCSKYHRRHLTILCELFQSAAPTRANATTVDQDEPCIAGRSTNTPPVTSAPSALSGVNAVLLQTGQVWTDSGSRRRLVRILLDSGSPAHIYSSGSLKAPQMPGYWKRRTFFGYVWPLEAPRSNVQSTGSSDSSRPT